MKLIRPHKMSAATVIGIVAAMLSLGTSVTAAGYKNADKTGASIAEFRDEIIKIRQQVDESLQALNKVVLAADSDPRKPYKAFQKTVPQVEEAANKAKKRSEEMKSKGKAYFKQWEEDLAKLNDPAIRQLAQQRKLKLQETFDAISVVMVPAREQFNTWLSGLKDLNTYLANDLTIHGINSARDLITKTTTSGQEVLASLDQVIAELNTVAATLTPAKAAK